MLAAAFGQAQTLQDRALAPIDSMDAEIVGLVLLELAAYSSNVCTHATLSQLPYTCFDEYTFHYESMIVLLAALRSCRTVTCLEFSNCTIMAERTVDLFIEHLRSGRSSIQEHHLRPAVPDDPAHCNPFNEPSEPVDWNLLITSNVGVTVSEMLVGSSVTSLTLHEDRLARIPRYDLLFDRLTQKEAVTRLRTLTIKSSVNNPVLQTLSQFLAATSRLHEHSVEFHCNSDPLSLLLLSGVRRNGSLHSAVWTLEETEPPSLYLRQVLAHCKRSKMLPKLLVGECAAHNGADGASRVDQVAMPSLFLAAQQARRTAPNTMFIDLLTGSETVGPWRQTIGAKRVSSGHAQ
jgi:hypothetical protein